MHIGKRIKEVVDQRGMSTQELATRIGKVRQTVSGYFKKEDLETGMLQKISEALDYDFFQYYKNPTLKSSPPRSGSGLSLVVNIPADKAVSVLCEAFGEYNGKLLASHLPDAGAS